jgi:hypothetical protein
VWWYHLLPIAIEDHSYGLKNWSKTGQFSWKPKKPPIFGKPADQIWNLKTLKKFEIKILKKLESISWFLVKQNSKNQSHESYKIRWSQNRRGNREKRKWPVPYKGATLGPYPQAPDLILHPRPPSSMPPPLDFDVFNRCATGPIYRLGLLVHQSY